MGNYVHAPIKLSVGKKKMRGLTIRAPEEEEQEEEDAVTMTSVKKSVEPAKVVEQVKEAHKEEKVEEEEEEEEEEQDEQVKTFSNVNKQLEQQFAPINFDEVEDDGGATTDQKSQFGSVSQTAKTGLRALRTKLDGSYAHHPNLWGAKTGLLRLEDDYDSATEWFDGEFARPDYALETMTVLAAKVCPENIDATLERLLTQGKHAIGDVRTVNADVGKRMLVVMESAMNGTGGSVSEANEILKELNGADQLVYERDRPIMAERLKELGEHKGASAIASILKGLEPMLLAADSLASMKNVEGYQAANRSLAWIAKMCEELLSIANKEA